MAYNTAPFMPLYGPNAGPSGAGTLTASVTITASTTVASANLPGNVGLYNGMQQIQIANKTSAWAHVNFGRSIAEIPAATVAASYPVAPGAVVVVSVDGEVGTASVILDAAPSSSAAVIFTRGTGT